MARITALAVAMALMMLPLGRAEQRPREAHPHGHPYESPLALSPAAYEFFHPSARHERVPQAHGLAPAPAPRGQLLRESEVRQASANVARADQEEGGVAPVGTVRHRAFRASLVAGMVAGAAAVAALVALGVLYAVARRRLARGGVAAAEAPMKANA